MSGARIQLSGDCDLSSLSCNTNRRVGNTYLPASMLFAPNTATDKASTSMDMAAQFDESDLEIKCSIIELAFNGQYAPANQPQAISSLGTIRGILQWLFG